MSDLPASRRLKVLLEIPSSRAILAVRQHQIARHEHLVSLPKQAVFARARALALAGTQGRPQQCVAPNAVDVVLIDRVLTRAISTHDLSQKHR